MPITVGERLKEARIELQRKEGRSPNAAAFAREIGIEPASLADLESGESKTPASNTLLRLRDRGINPDYIMYGKGPKFLVDSIEKKLERDTAMTMFDELDDEEQKNITDTMRMYLRRKPGRSPNDPFKEDPPKSDK